MQASDFLLIAAVVCLLAGFLRHRKQRRYLRRLLKVSTPDRGTRSERDLVVSLVEHGVKPNAIFHDLYVDLGRGYYSQVDLAVLTRQGIIVIEVKDYAGAIFGKATDAQWTQVLAFGREKHSFYNPVKQNEGHIEALRHELRHVAPRAVLFSVIVFSERATLHHVDGLSDDTYICYGSELPDVIKVIRHAHRRCAYADRRGAAFLLDQAVKNGADPSVVERHIRNVSTRHPSRD